MSRIYIFYTACSLVTQTVAPTLHGFQCLKICIQYLASDPHTPIFYPSIYCWGSNIIRLTWIWNQVEDYTNQNFLKCHQDADYAIILIIRRLV